MENISQRARAMRGEILNNQPPAGAPAAESSAESPVVLPGLEHHAETTGISLAAEPTAQNAAQKPAKQRPKGGAPFSNRNATKLGLRGFIATGSLPKGASWIRRVLGEYSRSLLEAVLAVHGSVGLYETALVQSATRLEAECLLSGRWLKLDYDSLTVMQRVELRRSISAASQQRDRILERLGLAGKLATNGRANGHHGHGSIDLPDDVLDALEAPDATSDEPEAVNGNEAQR
jgi:hypothetical protein